MRVRVRVRVRVRGGVGVRVAAGVHEGASVVRRVDTALPPRSHTVGHAHLGVGLGVGVGVGVGGRDSCVCSGVGSG